MKTYDDFFNTVKRPFTLGVDVDAYARIATNEEFLSKLTKVSLDDTSVPPGIVMYNAKDGNVYVREDFVHVLISGPTGSGKSASVNSNTLNYWAKTGNPIVITDPKGEAVANYAQHFKDNGYEVLVIDLKKPSRGIRISPLTEIVKKLRSFDPVIRDEGEIDLSNLLHSIIVDGTPSEDFYWSFNPYIFCCGLVKELVRRTDEDFEITIPILKMAADMVIANSDNVQKFTNTLGPDNPNRAELMNMLSISADVTRSGMAGHLYKGLSFCRSAGMIDMLSDNDLNVHSMAAGNPIALFIVCPDNTDIYDQFISIILDQIIKLLDYDADTIYGGRLPKDVLFLMEEFSNIPPIPSFRKVITNTRSRGIHFMISVQSLNQLYSRYGSDAGTIIDNCQDWICTAGDYSFASRLDEKIGKNAAGKNVITQNILRCLPLGRPLILLNQSNPYIAVLCMADRPAEKYEVETRTAKDLSFIDLEDLLFNPMHTFASKTSSEEDGEHHYHIPSHWVFEETPDWTDNIDNFKRSIVESSAGYGLNDSVVESDEALVFAVLSYYISKGIYYGQEIRIQALKEFQKAIDSDFTFDRLMELVTLITSDADFNGSAKCIADNGLLSEGITKNKMKDLIRRLWQDFRYIRRLDL